MIPAFCGIPAVTVTLAPAYAEHAEEKPTPVSRKTNRDATPLPADWMNINFLETHPLREQPVLGLFVMIP
jgi:hypothetical protein